MTSPVTSTSFAEWLAQGRLLRDSLAIERDATESRMHELTRQLDELDRTLGNPLSSTVRATEVKAEMSPTIVGAKPSNSTSSISELICEILASSKCTIRELHQKLTSEMLVEISLNRLHGMIGSMKRRGRLHAVGYKCVNGVECSVLSVGAIAKPNKSKPVVIPTTEPISKTVQDVVGELGNPTMDCITNRVRLKRFGDCTKKRVRQALRHLSRYNIVEAVRDQKSTVWRYRLAKSAPY